MALFNWTWEIVPKEDKNHEEVRLGRPHPNMPHDTFWYAGTRMEGERIWVKSKRAAMTFPSKDDAVKVWKYLGIEGLKFLDSSPVKSEY